MEYLNQDTQMRKQNRTTLESIEIVPKFSYALGKCFSVRPKPDIVKRGIVSIAFTSHMDVYVYIGYPGQFKYNTRTRVSIAILFTITIFRLQNKPDQYTHHINMYLTNNFRVF